MVFTAILEKTNIKSHEEFCIFPFLLPFLPANLGMSCSESVIDSRGTVCPANAGEQPLCRTALAKHCHNLTHLWGLYYHFGGNILPFWLLSLLDVC